MHILHKYFCLGWFNESGNVRNNKQTSICISLPEVRRFFVIIKKKKNFCFGGE